MNTIINHQLVIVDATWILTKTDPFNGIPIKLNTTIVGTDPVAIDSTCCRIMGLDPMNVGHIRNAEAYGLDQMNPELQGYSIDSLKKEVEDFSKQSSVNIY